MPHFYFDMRDDERLATDEDGLDFPDLDVAEREAAKAAAAIGRDLLPSGKTRTVTIEVRDEHGTPRVAVTVSMRRDRLS